MDEEFYEWLDRNFPNWTEKYKYSTCFDVYENELGFIYEWWNNG